MLDAGLLRNIYNTTMRRSSTFGLVIVTGAIVTDMVLDNVVDGFFRGKNANKSFDNIPAIRAQNAASQE